MSWLQLKLSSDAEQAELLSDLLSALGAVSVTLVDAADQPLFEPLPGETPLWHQTLVIGLFSADTDTEQLIGQFQQAWGNNALPPHRWEALEDQDWVRAWMEHFKPMRFGRRLWIIPGGFESPEPDAINIILDPGLAFGTGTHPTTAMCLNWLDAHPPAGKAAIDFGCGSGILSLAAARLGAKEVTAVDIDPQALQATRDNAGKNSLGGIHCYLPNALPEKPADLLLANILAGPLKELAPLFARHVKPGGELLLAGLLAEQVTEVIHACQTWFEMSIDQQQEQWVCLHGQRRESAQA